ncbi:hypothetical protein [Lentzea sp. NPDC051838]|uniref:hypothetical protein n=1 Tax=Lentzea sp. NPDC051838 TaxID=3154849 RepID=UPI0034410475
MFRLEQVELKLAIGVVAVTMVLIGGCSTQRVESPTFGPTPTVTTTALPTAPTNPAGPAKYVTATVKSCAEIGQGTGGRLSPQPDDGRGLGSNSSARSCTVKAADQTEVFNIRSWDNTDDATGVRSGAEHAEKYFMDRTKTWERDTSVNIGSDARWRAKSTTACTLEVLDGNGVLTVGRVSDTSVDQELCRAAVRDLAKKFFVAVQP